MPDVGSSVSKVMYLSPPLAALPHTRVLVSGATLCLFVGGLAANMRYRVCGLAIIRVV